jgi:hypothetical protein
MADERKLGKRKLSNYFPEFAHGPAKIFTTNITR